MPSRGISSTLPQTRPSEDGTFSLFRRGVERGGATIPPVWPQDDPQEDLKMISKWPQTISKWVQNDLKMPSGWPQDDSQDDLRLTSKWFPNGVRMTWKCPNHDPRMISKMTWRWYQNDEKISSELLSSDYIMPISWVYNDYTMIISRLYHDYIMTITWLENEYTMSIKWLYKD